jgi:hypothetical protein
MNLHRNFFATNAPNPLHWTQNSCFVSFHTVLLMHESRCKMDRTSAINAKVHLTKLRRKFSQWKHPIHSIGPKTHVLGHFATFRYCTKVGAKRAEMMPLTHKFSKQSCVRIFRNKSTQSSSLHPKLTFWGAPQKSVQNLLNLVLGPFAPYPVH